MKRLFGWLLILPLLFVLIYAKPIIAAADDIQALKKQVQELLRRIEQLESEQAKTNETISSQKEVLTKREKVLDAIEKFTASFKVDGRIAAGYLDTKNGGSYPKGSFEIPDAKVKFTYAPDDQFKVVMRASLSNASFNELDRMYLESKILDKLIPLGLDIKTTLGRLSPNFGEETYYNNPVEGALTSNSAANVGWRDEGIEFSGAVGNSIPFGWSVSVSNANSGTGSDNTTPKAFAGKVFYKGFDPLYLSASYFHSGDMRTADTDVEIAGLATKPAGATNWKREIWEVDLRYDFEKGKNTVASPVYSDSKAIIMASLGGFTDDANKGVKDRDGNYGFIEGIYNFDEKIYGAARYSVVDLDGKQVAKLNGVNANKYDRFSLGLGYRFTSKTILKLTYDWNKESNVTKSDKQAGKDNNDMLSVLVGTAF